MSQNKSYTPDLSLKTPQVIGRQQEIKRLNNFVKECLDFSNPSDPSKFDTTDINDIITSSLDLIMPAFQDSSKKIDFTLFFCIYLAPANKKAPTSKRDKCLILLVGREGFEPSTN